MRSTVLAGLGYLLIFGVVLTAVSLRHVLITASNRPSSQMDVNPAPELASGTELRHLSTYTPRR